MTTAKHYAQDVIDKAKYSFQMERSKEIHVNIDGAQCGVGGNDSWCATPLKPYILGAKPRSYRFRMIPITDTETVDSKVLCRPRAFPIEIQQVGAQPHSEIETNRLLLRRFGLRPGPQHASFYIPEDDPAWALYKDKSWQPAKSKVVAAMDSMVDRQFGEILALLKELGIDDNTIVFFASDNQNSVLSAT